MLINITNAVMGHDKIIFNPVTHDNYVWLTLPSPPHLTLSLFLLSLSRSLFFLPPSLCLSSQLCYSHISVNVCHRPRSHHSSHMSFTFRFLISCICLLKKTSLNKTKNVSRTLQGPSQSYPGPNKQDNKSCSRGHRISYLSWKLLQRIVLVWYCMAMLLFVRCVWYVYTPCKKYYALLYFTPPFKEIFGPEHMSRLRNRETLLC